MILQDLQYTLGLEYNSYPLTVNKSKMEQSIGSDCVVEIRDILESQQSLIKSKILLLEKENEEDVFFVIDLGEIVHKYANWVRRLPRVKPFYAVKCNDDHAVLKILADLGSGFDCASQNEIQKILKLGVDPVRIIYANTIKQGSFLKYSAGKNVSTMTFDNETELYKIKAVFPGARLVLRILPAHYKARFEIGVKFGCPMDDVKNLLAIAKSLTLNVVGVSFHVGSGCLETEAFAGTIKTAREVFDLACDLGFKMELLDIGGGFPGHETGHGEVSFEEMADVINSSLEKYFPEEEGVKVIAEPGRYLATSAYSIAVKIIGKRVMPRHQKNEGMHHYHTSESDKAAIMYYINDGVHGSFSFLVYQKHALSTSTMQFVRHEEHDTGTVLSSSVWGPTCDGLDCVLEDCQLPELSVGDWIYFDNMGAYSIVLGSNFNGMPRPRYFYYCQADIWCVLFMKPYCTRNTSFLVNSTVHCRKYESTKELGKVTSKGCDYKSSIFVIMSFSCLIYR
ncbi:hypothetical protein ScPMuIL_005493, partial [Solemya velum]